MRPGGYLEAFASGLDCLAEPQRFEPRVARERALSRHWQGFANLASSGRAGCRPVAWPNPDPMGPKPLASAPKGYPVQGFFPSETRAIGPSQEVSSCGHRAAATRRGGRGSVASIARARPNRFRLGESCRWRSRESATRFLPSWAVGTRVSCREFRLRRVRNAGSGSPQGPASTRSQGLWACQAPQPRKARGYCLLLHGSLHLNFPSRFSARVSQGRSQASKKRLAGGPGGLGGTLTRGFAWDRWVV